MGYLPSDDFKVNYARPDKNRNETPGVLHSAV